MSGRITMDRKIEEWIDKKLLDAPRYICDYMLSTKETKTSSTRKAYLNYLLQYFDFIQKNNIDICDVKPMHIDRYREYIINGGEKKNGSQIVNAKLAAIISFYGFLKENNFIQNNPCDVKKKLKCKQSRTFVYMTDQEIDELKNGISYCINRKSGKYKNRDLCIVSLGCSTGLRVSAIVNIDINDIDFEQKSIKVIEKGDKEREVFVGDNTMKTIKNWLNDRAKLINNSDEPALFISQKHNRISVRAVEEMLQRETRNMNKHITPHKMRSTCAMKLYDKTGDIYLTAQQLGHANIKNTMIYARATEEKRRMAADILD